MNDSLHILFIGLGTNLGDRWENLASARRSLPPGITILDESPVYETRPWGFTDQPDFLNQVVKGQTELSPLDLLAYLKHREARLGRTPTFKNGPRVVDLDILFYDDLIFESPTLTIPHPGIPIRAFVLAPLADIAPNFCHPASGKKISELIAEIDSQDVKKTTP